MIEFEAVLVRPEGIGTWTYVTIPCSIEHLYGTKAQVRVKGAINGFPYRGSLMPHGNGSHYMVVNKSLRNEAKAQVGESVHMTMELDTAPREIELPDDLAAGLEQDEQARSAFDALSYSHKKEYITWIEEAKKAETRQNRIVKSIEKLRAGKRLK
ncbi:YdeI/OmpD-associated family protein [Paenibacillus harenae]|uniref:YdeI/OmpD-associated family protein n=1 Tax=Paenibacillus harenae TaxID=306543 RepID=UPI00278FBCF4|nr:YdeI/OmpD-associated family protein [Paenibacillus harenae]MDQ0063420.1 hypothetical protein [Paenibacillus harenae]